MSTTEIKDEELPNWAKTPEIRLALSRYEEQLKWYKPQMSRKAFWYKGTYTAAIVLGGLTPVLVVLQALLVGQQIWITILIALFPAVAAILTSLNGFYQWKESYIRYAFTTEALKSEYIKFITRSTPDYNDNNKKEKALENFVRRIESIALKETQDWQSQQQQALDLEELLQKVEDKTQEPPQPPQSH